jgi:hypothetical protein
MDEIFRRIHGSIQEKGHWRPKWNGRINSLYKNLNIIDVIEIRRLGWAGHITKMEAERIPKKTVCGKFHNIRLVAKPKTRQEDVIRRDAIHILGIQA